MSFDLDLLPTFAVFAETRSFTETGRRCGLTQPAAHGQVKRLTEQVGEALYQREGRTLVLTERGEALAALARRVCRLRDGFLGERARPRLAAGRGAWTHLLLPRLGAALEGVQPIVADGRQALQLVRAGRAEAGVTVELPDLPHRTLFEVGTHLLVPLDHGLRETVTLAELACERWILPSRGRPHRSVLEALCRRAGFDPVVAVECDDWAVTAGFVALGLGIAAVNDFVTHPGARVVELQDGPVQRYRLFWRDGEAPEWLDDPRQ